ncbi:membrane-anchored ubiquitin-fold protein 3-like isoform X2 [Salvia splendens]|uniref:membrane-anchored ubiquitin-fold protein 3-like isoform X2 n=1 Tax=Salvia splendens TaxID=180675 RepID=UPI001C26E778|nr:membrane-anchored ubiquitin-fold protein 3-like isoform X2 [Salvia splendens]
MAVILGRASIALPQLSLLSKKQSFQNGPKTLPFVFFCWCGYLEKDGISRITICAVSWYPSTSFDVADKENGPKSINDIKLINAGKILENDRTLDQSRTPLSEVPGDVITMLVVVQSPLPDKHSDKLQDESQNKTGCSCSIM